MVNIPKPKLYTCQKVGCGHQWLQRLKIYHDKDDKKVIRVDGSQDPNNCTKCKSPTWDIPRE